MSVQTRCPNPACSQVNAVDPSQVRQRVRCPACGTKYVAESAVVDRPAAATDTQPAPRPAPAPEATRIGRFVVREKLGAGAFGTVYRAYDPQLDREVALKVPHPSALDNPRQVERFLREAKAAAQLRHPHIVPVFDAGTDGGRPYLATAFIKGRPLADAIEDGGMEYDRAARLARELAEALAYAHEQGIVHRDVKPANILLDEHDHAHLTDFGLAARQDAEAKLTSDGAVLGTPAYMAPEQAAGQKGEARPAVDQYAAGVVLYEMLTGTVPFRGTPAKVIYHAINTEPPAITDVRKHISKDLDTVCRKAMAKRPEERYADCQALADDLRRWLEREPVKARRAGARERLVRWARREPRLALSVGAAVGALVLAAVVAGVSAVWLSASATELRQANRDAQAAEMLAREREQEATRAAEAARTAERDRANEAVAARDAQRKAETAEEKARSAAQVAEAEKKIADKALADWKEALNRVGIAANEIRELEGAVAKAIQAAKDQNLDNVLAAASSRVKDADFAAAGEQLAKVPPEHRGWEWHVLDRFAQTKGIPYAETRLGVGRDTLYSLRFSRNLARAVAVDNPRPGVTEFAVLDLDTGAELFRTTAPGNTGVEDVQRTALSRDGTYLAHVVLGRFGKGQVPAAARMYLWDVIRQKALTKDPIDLPFFPEAVAFHPKTDELAVGGFFGEHLAKFALFDGTTGQRLRIVEPLGLNKKPTGFGYIPDGTELYFSYLKVMGRVSLGKKTVVAKHDCKALPGRGNGFLPLPPDRLLAWDDRVRVWGLRQQAVIGELADSGDLVWPDLVVSTDGKRATGFVLGKDGTVGLRAWSMASGKVTLDLPGLAKFGETVSPYDGKNTKPAVVSGLRDFAVSADGDRVVYRHDRAVRVIKVPARSD